MPITAYQLQQRKHHLGSSDVAALFGLNKFANAYDVWLEKTGQLAEAPGNEAQALGNEFETVILARAEKELGPLRRNQYRSAQRLGLPLGSNIDAIVVETGRPVEAKTSGIWWPVEETWGEPGTDQVPDRVLIQSQVHLICTDTDLCHAPKMGWGMRQDLYEVPRDDDMVKQICDYAAAWWQRHVVEGQAPDGVPKLDTVKRCLRQTGKAVDVPGKLIEKWRRAVKLAGRVDKLKDAAQAAVLAALGDAEIGTCDLGTVTYLETYRKGHVVEPKMGRTIRWKEKKAGS
ncbi:MAG: YqaJ viral recombinase family protein [Planctomycetes bacterium]|nr:YqaJ viral recombinase family protein [Planctomycetota bacterium]